MNLKNAISLVNGEEGFSVKKTLIGVLASAMIGSSISAVPAFAATSSTQDQVSLNLNGVTVGNFVTEYVQGRFYVSVDSFAKYYNATYSYDNKSNTLTLNDQIVSNKYGSHHVKAGTLVASIRALVEALGRDHSEIGWNDNTKTVNATILPAGTVKITPAVPQMGEHWANPKDMPLGPIYGLYNGKLVFLEYMPAKDLDKTVHDIPGTTVPIPSKIDHTDIDWNPEGHEGYLVPHYDFHLYFITRAEQNQIGAQPDTNTSSLVALGDSITFGYNLDPANKQPSTLAFPYLMGNVLHYDVADLGNPGWTSTNLLKALSTSSFEDALKTAKLVTVDIGSNDLLQLAEKDGLLTPSNTNPTLTDAQKKEFSDAVQQFGTNITKILGTVKTEAPNATVEVINLYNPLPTTLTSLHAIGDQFIKAENALITAAAAQYKMPVADAYTAIEGHQSDLIRPLDVHPNAAGHQAIAKAAVAALEAK